MSYLLFNMHALLSAFSLIAVALAALIGRSGAFMVKCMAGGGYLSLQFVNLHGCNIWPVPIQPAHSADCFVTGIGEKNNYNSGTYHAPQRLGIPLGYWKETAVLSFQV